MTVIGYLIHEDDGYVLTEDGDRLIVYEAADIVDYAPLAPAPVAPKPGEYRFLLFTALGADLITEIPLYDWSYESVLNDAGTFTASFSAADRRAIAANLTPGQRLIAVEREGVIEWCGILWAWSYDDFDNKRLSLEAAEMLSYFAHRRIRTHLSYTAQDAHDVIWAMIAYAQTASDLGIINEANHLGTTVTLDYPAKERTVLLDAMKEIASAESIDFELFTEWGDPDVRGRHDLKHTFRSFLPKGRITSFVLEFGRNIDSYSVKHDASAGANLFDALGTNAATIATASNVGSGEIQLDDAADFDHVVAVPTLQLLANAKLDVIHADPVAFDVTITIGRSPVPGEVRPGDYVWVRIDNPPDMIDALYRCLKTAVAPDDAGNEVVTLSFGLIDILQPSDAIAASIIRAKRLAEKAIRL